jgi:hypothetical protein
MNNGLGSSMTYLVKIVNQALWSAGNLENRNYQGCLGLLKNLQKDYMITPLA